MPFPPTIGLIAGSGILPLSFAEQAKKRGYVLKTVAIRGAASGRLERFCDEMIWLSIGQVGALISFFKKHKIKRAVMHGKVEHSQLFQKLKLDLKAITLLARLKDRSGESILKALAGELLKNGTKLIDGRFLLDGLLVNRGWVSHETKVKEVQEAIHHGLKRARVLARWGIGQTIVLKKKVVVAVEAVDGTDETIKRAGEFAGPGTIVIKMSSPHQDWRFDIPTVGPKTIETMIKAGSRGMVLEGGRTFILEKEKTLRVAKNNEIFILAV
jgi:UDP-2,3-diacylglucosamine hydrolase